MTAMTIASRPDIVVVGAGPAGLTAAYLLAKAGKRVVVLEADPVYVGGISRTVEYKGFRFDIGGHRFFSKAWQVEALWTELLGQDMLERPRLSRIYYRNKFFDYPIRPSNVLRNLGLVESAASVLSYLRARLRPVKNPRSVEDWITNQFGRRLYEMFFKTYTEKVWGMQCSEISADWAAQRIKGLSLRSAVWNAIRLTRTPPRDQAIKTLIESFRYPRLGPGMMWEAARDRVRALGGDVLHGRRVTGFHRESNGAWTIRANTTDGREEFFSAPHVISSAPMRELATGLTPPLSATTRDAALSLRYRDFILVALIVRERRPLPDNWIYIHDPGVRVGRVQVFKSWSPEMVPDPAMTCLGMEYFCFEGDAMWTSTDAQLIEQATSEVVTLGLAERADVVDGSVVRQQKAYPVYDDDYARHVATIRAELEGRYAGLHVVGRNGMHKYNNQDHAMMTAMLTADTIITGQPHDVWRVNADAEYHESDERGSTGERFVPRRI